ncbi:MAG: DUF6174 domain-containing protein [Thiofilum sp.]|uniref:DUF6174 domain-containing protein n=1 Tax=Thiofilum sp. TaxID=2212733 RepID=UPI0025DFBC4C|nr:DUF6174 domain-containing protein [Thiofilum sp.]MBK8453923.1 hypothetical protein [Thiofilum sp.]
MKTIIKALLLSTLVFNTPSFADSVSLSAQPRVTIKAPLAPALLKAQAQLNQAQAKWKKTQPQHYSYYLQRSCFCTPDYTKPIMLRVFKGKVQQATLMPEGKPLPANRKTEAIPMEGVFKLIQEAINRRAAKITVTYHVQYGYPKQVSIDYDQRMADEELYLTISNFKVASGLKPNQNTK